ncbi:MAG: prefoldin subunit alpha [Candidatus Natronoplasma sp.]
MVDEQEFRNKVNRLQNLNAQIEIFENQVEFLKEKIQEHETAKNTMKEYMKKEEGSELLVPIGASSYLYSRVGSKDKVLIGLGADISAEKNVDEAVDVIDKRKKEVEDNKEEIQKRLKELEVDAQKLEREVQQEYQQLQQGQQQVQM